MLIARIFPENSIEMILDGVVRSGIKRKFIVIGGYDTEYGRQLVNKFGHLDYIQFLGGVYDINVLNNLRYFSNLYFHGHTVGGTNPSLLEAMASNALICANNNVYNSAILGMDAHYFRTSLDVSELILNVNKSGSKALLSANIEKIRSIYSWDIITDQYLDHFMQITGGLKNENKIFNLAS
jgi:glycosyltransferase involved in cell wall biosynthesis